MAYLDDLRARERGLLDNPDSFTGSAAYQSGLNQSLLGATRGSSLNRGSGNALAQLARTSGDYLMGYRGSELDRIGSAIGREGQYELGAEGNRLTGIRDANNFTLGSQQNANTRRIGDQNFGLGMGRLEADRWQNQANYNLGQQSNATNWFNAVTNRGAAQSQDWNNTQRTNQNWYDRFF